MADRKSSNKTNTEANENLAGSRSQFPLMGDAHRLMARLNARRIWKEYAESVGSSGYDGPTLGGEVLDSEEMPQVGSSFHRYIIEDRVEDASFEDLEGPVGPEGPESIGPLDPEGDGPPGGHEAGSVHYY